MNSRKRMTASKRMKKKWRSIPPEKDSAVFAFSISRKEKEKEKVIPVTLRTFLDYLKW